MLTVATLLWQPNKKSLDFSRCYNETWVEKLYRGFARNLTAPFRFVLYTDRERAYSEPVEQLVQPDLGQGGYGDCIRPYALGAPMILVGLDTVVTGNCDDLARYCLEEKVPALPRDPYKPAIACNGVALIPSGYAKVATTHKGQNDMEWVRSFDHVFIDDAFPGQVKSFKGHVKQHGLGDVRICYFHGQEKPHQLPHVDWIARHWR